MTSFWALAVARDELARTRVNVVRHHGHDALQQVWLEVLAGRSAPRTGHVVTF